MGGRAPGAGRCAVSGCRGHRRSGQIAFRCPSCASRCDAGDLVALLPRLPFFAVCCQWCGFHGGLLSFARLESYG